MNRGGRGRGPGRLSSSSAGLFWLDPSLTQQPVRGHLSLALDGDVAPQLQLETLEVLQNLVTCCRHVDLQRCEEETQVLREVLSCDPRMVT